MHAWYFLNNLNSWIFTKQTIEDKILLYCRREQAYLPVPGVPLLVSTDLSTRLPLQSIISFATFTYFARIKQLTSLLSEWYLG